MQLAGSVRDGGWNEGATIRLEVQALANALSSPRLLARRIGFRMGAHRSCPVVAATSGGPKERVDMERWLNSPTKLHSLVRS
jgi:hypothetical protein